VYYVFVPDIVLRIKKIFLLYQCISYSFCDSPTGGRTT